MLPDVRVGFEIFLFPEHMHFIFFFMESLEGSRSIRAPKKNNDRTVVMPVFLNLLIVEGKRTKHPTKNPSTGTFNVSSVLAMPWQCCCSFCVLPSHPSPWYL